MVVMVQHGQSVADVDWFHDTTDADAAPSRAQQVPTFMQTLLYARTGYAGEISTRPVHAVRFPHFPLAPTQ